MKILLFISLFSIILFIGCSGAKTENFVASQSDTLGVFNKIITSTEIMTLLRNYKADTIFIIKNKNFPRPLLLNFQNNKKIIFIEKVDGYPKYGHFDFSKLQISFEQLKINKDSADCTVLIKTIGLLGNFKLVNYRGAWNIIEYSKIMI